VVSVCVVDVYEAVMSAHLSTSPSSQCMSWATDHRPRPTDGPRWCKSWWAQVLIAADVVRGSARVRRIPCRRRNTATLIHRRAGKKLDLGETF